jgi:hypothetical protein
MVGSLTLSRQARRLSGTSILHALLELAEPMQNFVGVEPMSEQSLVETLGLDKAAVEGICNSVTKQRRASLRCMNTL